jgi:hypothetical protein
MTSAWCHVARAAALAAVWALLTAATSKVELMPQDGRSQPFGAAAHVWLKEAADHHTRFGQRPVLDRTWHIDWELDWNGRSYEVRSEPGQADSDGTFALRRMGPDSPLYVGQMMAPGDPADAKFEYFLLWRLSAHEFIGYLRLGETECDVLTPEKLAAIGIAEADREDCIVTSWPEVGALLLAFAQTRPQPLGTIRLVRHRPKPR